MRSEGSDEKNDMHGLRLGGAAWSLATELHKFVFPSHWGLHSLSCVTHNECVFAESDFGKNTLH